MMTRWTLRKLMVSVLFDEATPQERDLLQNVMTKRPAVKEEFEQLRRTISVIDSREPVPPAPPLLPLIKQRLGARKAMHHSPGRLLTYSSVAVSFAVAIFLLMTFSLPKNAATPSSATASVRDSVLYNAIRESLALKAQGDEANATLLLKSAIEANLDDPLAGRAQMELADILFSRLKRFDEAYEAYQTLRAKYPLVFSSSSENISRLDLLDEARRDNFAGLRLLETARHTSPSIIQPWEEILARYPGSRIAALAMREMVERTLASAISLNERAEKTAPLEALRAQFTHPLAIAQINLELSKTYWIRFANKEKAFLLANEALHSQDPRVVAMARDFLEELEKATDHQDQ